MKKILLFLVITLLVYGCGSSDDPSGEAGGDDFDRAVLLTNAADNIIIPAFEDLVTELTTLQSAKDAFIADVTEENLSSLRVSWLSAYKVWQHVELFNIGEAENLLYSFQMNVYPVTVTDVESNIANGSYDLTSANNNDAVGFPAVDYLLYGIADTDTDILGKYTTDVNSEGYLNYLSDVIDRMKSLTQIVLDDWKDNFRTSFINSTDNTATSSLNKLVNDFIFYYEKGLRANKIGIPAGNFSNDPLPEKVEAFYNKVASKELALEALDAVQDFFNGVSYGSSAEGQSFNDYLISLERTDLVSLINLRFNEAREKIDILDDDFNAQIITDNTKMTEAYDALQLVVVLLKIDMLQALNVSVDFVDADGD